MCQLDVTLGDSHRAEAQELEALQAEKNRLDQVFGGGKRPVRKSLRAHITFLERELRMAGTELGPMVRESSA